MTGRAVDESHVREGLANVRLSGRLETVQTDPTVLLDSAHNPVEARALAGSLRAHWLCDEGRALTLVIGILADKDQASMVRALAGIATRVIVTQPPLGERAGDPEGMLRLFGKALGGTQVTFDPSPGRALDIALADTPRDGVVCVTGSMFLVGALRERWVPEQRTLERRTADP
jgi:dihydrofolate synthase/folylpolyglutamate synthase